MSAHAAPSRHSTAREGDLRAVGDAEGSVDQPRRLRGAGGEAVVVEHGDADEQVPHLRRQAEVVGRLDADPDGADEVALPGERNPLHETPETGGIDLVDLLDLTRPRPEIGRAGRARRRDQHRAQHGAARRRCPAVVEEWMDHIGEIVPTEEEPSGRWSAQASGELLGAQLGGEQRRLPPVVGLALEPDRPPLDLRRARARSEGGRTARPSSRRGSPGRPTARRGDASCSSAKDRIVSSSR